MQCKVVTYMFDKILIIVNLPARIMEIFMKTLSSSLYECPVDTVCVGHTHRAPEPEPGALLQLGVPLSS
jgi:hypothetical protein